MRRFFSLLAFLVPLAFAPFASCHAASTPWMQEPEVRLRLLTAKDSVGAEDSSLSLGLEIRLAEGWHTYWRSPGLAGQPPRLDWSGSSNIAEATILYPLPERMTLLGLETVGYKEDVLFPLKAQLTRKGQAVEARTEIDLLLCGDVCLPKHFSLSLSLPAGNGAPAPEAALIEKALARVPPKESASLSFGKLVRHDKSIEIPLRGAQALSAPDLLIEGGDDVSFGLPQAALASDGKTALFTASLDGALPEGKSLKDIPLTLTALDGSQALERVFVADAQEGSGLSLLAALLFGLLGGLLLNFMPCVLPVLSLKLMGLARHGGGEKKTIRRAFLATSAGILFSFLLLALAAIALKAAGHAVGWGMQFQNAGFLLFMIVVLTFFAANLLGFFEIPLPRFLADSAAHARHRGLGGEFVTGALATLLATPCSAPFLGTAVTFALTGGSEEILAIFTALGLGMALPYLGVALYPRLAAALPHPGRWMETLSRFLGLGLAAAALWLLFVLKQQIGRDLAVLIALAVGGIVVQLFLRHKKILRLLTLPVLALALGLSAGAVYIAGAPSAHAPEMGAWQAFDEETLARDLAAGKTVFVDVTADWCLTCKANKRFALTHGEVQKRLFEDKHIVALQADWTGPNEAAQAFLRKHGRYGIPFNIVFGPRAPEGIALPELLTPSAVLEAIDKAGGKACPAEAATC